MRRKVSIGRSLRLALLGLTVVLAVLAGIGVAQLYDARQRYEDRLSRAYAVEAAAGRLLAAGVVEEATLRTATPRERARAARRARAAFADSAARARALTRDDPASRRLVDRAIADQGAVRRAGGGRGALDAREAIARLVDRQHARRAAARDRVSRDSRRALIVVGGFGVLAVLLALGLVTAILTGLRRPLDELVDAAGRLAGGDLHVRVRDDLPGELAELGRAFNGMAEDLERAQRAVAEERERLAVTVESLGDGLLVVEDGRVASVNPRACELLGDVEVGAPADAVPGLPDPLDALAGEVVAERGRRTLAISATRLGFGSRGLVWTVRDVSERMRLERLKSEFVATASHELRSPLTSIKGFVELLHASPGLSERQREWVEIVLVSANRLVDLVNDLLDVARIEAGRVEIHRRPTDVGDTAREVARLLTPRIAGRRQVLALELPPDLPPAMADPARLRQVLTNLLTNAHQYTEDGGRIELRAEAVDGTVRIDVADTGRGMTAEELERVFDRFYRARPRPGSERANEPGTGLGLAIVRSLVDLQGGSVAVDSAPGEGTTFSVRLPRAPAGDGDPGLEGRRVLVVDDDPPAAEAITGALADAGVEAIAVHDAGEAIRRLRRERFDAMTLDVLMRGASGFDVLRAVRGDPELRDLPVVVVSAFSARRALAGEWAVAKPVDARELATALGAAVQRGRVRVLGVGRPAVRARAEPMLAELGIELAWAQSAEEAARRAAETYFEIALVDAGMDGAQDAVRSVRLRGRRLRRTVVVLAGDADADGLARLDADPVPIEQAGSAVVAALRGH